MVELYLHSDLHFLSVGKAVHLPSAEHRDVLACRVNASERYMRTKLPLCAEMICLLLCESLEPARIKVSPY
jgi:hypothetical protein